MNSPKFPDRGLYAIVDITSLERRKIDPFHFARAVIEGTPTIVQIRAKEQSARETLAILRKLVPLCRQAGVLCFANDRPDLAVLAGCDGFHVGQEDLPLAEAQRVAPGLLSGISTHTPAQIDEALRKTPSYIAVGPVFPTVSKLNPDPVVGLDLLRKTVSQAPCPVVAIGGINAEQAPVLARIGVLGAVISALLPDEEDMSQVTERTRTLACILRGDST